MNTYETTLNIQYGAFIYISVSSDVSASCWTTDFSTSSSSNEIHSGSTQESDAHFMKMKEEN